MKFHPIQFTSEMMMANIAGVKSQTRRTSGLNKVNAESLYSSVKGTSLNQWIFTDTRKPSALVKSPYGSVGDTLWFRESYAPNYFDAGKHGYKADWTDKANDADIKEPKWKPSIHMPASACRMWGVIIRIRIERLKDISESDAIAEGLSRRDGKWPLFLCKGLLTVHHRTTAQESYLSLFRMIYGEEELEKNPWVWVVQYHVMKEAPKGWSEYLEALENKKRAGR